MRLPASLRQLLSDPIGRKRKEECRRKDAILTFERNRARTCLVPNEIARPIIPQEASSFLSKLPLEIRRLIYQYYFGNTAFHLVHDVAVRGWHGRNPLRIYSRRSLGRSKVPTLSDDNQGEKQVGLIDSQLVKTLHFSLPYNRPPKVCRTSIPSRSFSLLALHFFTIRPNSWNLRNEVALIYGGVLEASRNPSNRK